MLEDFRKRYPKNALTPEAGNKLAAVYLELGQSERAATELDAIAARTADPKRAGDLLWQAAELHDSAGVRSAAAKSYERYLTLAPALAPALEARYRLAGIARQDGNAKAALSLMKELMLAEQNGASARTDRTRYLGASAALALAEPVAVSYRNVALVEPLAKNLKLKKARMEDTLKALALATDYGVAEISTEATFKIAATYRDFGTSLLASQRPARLSKAEREQYDVLLEEQAYPFEEKAIEIHEINARRSADGIYDQWVQNSFAALRELKPARYGKTERREAGPQSGSLNQAGIAWREQGQFDKAAAAYQAAIAQDAGNGTAVLNLGVLYDLYLGDTARAMEMYTRYLGQTPEGDAEVSRWVTELKNRKPLPAGQKDTP